MPSEIDNADTPLLSILVPVYNERAYLRRCVERVLEAPLPEGLAREIVMVDDCSTDGTADLVRSIAEGHPETIRAFYQRKNQGKGAAIRRAVAEMRGQYAIFQDADLEYDPNEYPVVLAPLLDGRADVVYGSRFASSPVRRVIDYRHSLGNQILTHASNFFTGLNLTDMETCYKAFRADVLRNIPIRSNRFGMEPEITAKIAKRGCEVFEVPISYFGRTCAEGKKIGWKDGVSALATILKYWMIDDCYGERRGRGIHDDLAGATRFNKWVVRAIEPYLGDRILEIGAGVGNISRFLPKKERLTVSDHDPHYLEILRETFHDNDLVDAVRLDLDRDADFEALAERRFDTVVCLNSLERADDDRAALERIKSLLRPGGRLILRVPQYQGLYGSYDRRLETRRRYDRRELGRILTDSGYDVQKMRSLNSLAILGWWFNSSLLKRQSMSKFQIKIFDSLVPLLRPVESALPFLPGLSLICVAKVR